MGGGNCPPDCPLPPPATTPLTMVQIDSKVYIIQHKACACQMPGPMYTTSQQGGTKKM